LRNPDILVLTRKREAELQFTKHLYDADEKRAVGAVWASRSAGKCRFLMPTEGGFSLMPKCIAKC